MRRTTFVPNLMLWALALVSAVGFCSARSSGQEPKTGDVPVVVVPVNQTKLIQMSGKQVIKEARNENSKVARIVPRQDDPTAILVTGLEPGITRLTLVDEKKNVELADIQVPDEDLEKRRVLLAKLIREQAPLSQVDVITTGPNGVILTGTTSSPAAVQLIADLTRSVFSGRGTGSSGAVSIINNIRVAGVQQVQLEVFVAAVNRSELRNMTFSWLATANRSFIGSILGSPLNLAGSIAGGATSATGSLASTPNLPFGIIRNNGSFIGFLEALRNEKLAKIYSRSAVSTLSGQAAQFTSGGETPILTASGQGAPSVQYKQFGTVVSFLPVVLGDGKIHLQVTSEISSRDDAAGLSIPGVIPTIVPGFKTRQARSAIQLEDGQTLAIGGLIQNTVNASVSKVPVLGDLPFLGVAFTSKSFVEDEEELIVLVTPRLVEGMHCRQLPQYLPGRETRSPDDFELFLEGLLEAPRGQRTTGIHPQTYQPAFRNAPNIGQYPCDSNGCGTATGTAPCGPVSQATGVHAGRTAQAGAIIPAPTGLSAVKNAPQQAAVVPTTQQPFTPATPTLPEIRTIGTPEQPGLQSIRPVGAEVQTPPVSFGTVTEEPRRP